MRTIQQGREIYNRSCTMCHGQDGTAGDRGPALAARRRYLRTSERDLFDAIKNGIAGTLMPASPLPDADVSKMVAYIRSLRATAIDAPVAGDVARGGQIFDGKGRLPRMSHAERPGGLLGPDLSNIAAERSVRFLEESLTNAKPHIPHGYQPVRVVTADGRSIRGVLKNEHNFSLQLLDTDGKLHLLARDDVREIEYEKQSLMPADYDKTLSATELQDLLAFLSRQGRQPRRTGGRAMKRADRVRSDCRAAARQVTYDDLAQGRSAKLAQLLRQLTTRSGTRCSIRSTPATSAIWSPQWVYHIPGASRLESVPVVVDGVMYVSQPNEVYALDGRTGRLIWDIIISPPCAKDRTAAWR